MTEQQSLFGDMATDGGVRTDGASVTADSPQDVRAQAAARAADLRHLLDYHAYRYYALDAPEITDAAFDKLLVELQQAGELEFTAGWRPVIPLSVCGGGKASARDGTL